MTERILGVDPRCLSYKVIATPEENFSSFVGAHSFRAHFHLRSEIEAWNVHQWYSSTGISRAISRATFPALCLDYSTSGSEEQSLERYGICLPKRANRWDCWPFPDELLRFTHPRDNSKRKNRRSVKNRHISHQLERSLAETRKFHGKLVTGMRWSPSISRSSTNMRGT